jgi:hypothetical protein
MGAARKGGAFPQNGAAEPLTTRNYHMDEVARGKITGLAHIRRAGSCMHAPRFCHRQRNKLRDRDVGEECRRYRCEDPSW